MENVDILLSTFNGAKFLSEQIESIINQDYPNWILYIHDDGSSDETIEIIRLYSQKHPEKINFLDDKINTGGAKNNFFHLLQYSKSDYTMFCDQDDVWLPNKISLSLELLKKHSQKDIPCIVFTDLYVVDEYLNLIHESMITYHQSKIPKNLEDAVFKNSVSGCTMLFNRELRSVISTPKDAIMHDWWLTIECFRNNGILLYLDKSTILYRQHQKNVIGAQKNNFLKKILNFNTSVKKIILHYKQYKLVYNTGFVTYVLKKIKKYDFN